MKVLLFLIAVLFLMARSTLACSIASTQAASPPPSCFQFQPAISGNCQLAGIETIKNKNYKEAALANLAFEYALAGALDQSLDLSDRLRADQRIKSLSVIVGMIGSLQGQRSPDQSVAMLTRISQAADSLKTPAVKANLLTEIVQAWIRLERKDEALKMLPKLLATSPIN